MRTDIGRVSFDEINHFVGVFHQMGRVPLESDFNEQSELALRMVQRVAADAMRTGSPNDGFRVGTRVLVDACESRRNWSATPANAALFVDYFDHRVGDGSLVALGATAISRRLDAPLDLSEVRDVVIAIKATPASACTFYVGDGVATHQFTMTIAFEDDGWQIVTATPGAWPAGFAANAVVEYGFTGLTAPTRYSIDFLSADLPLRTMVVRPDRGDAYVALPAAASLSADDDDRIWGETGVRAANAAQVACTLDAPADFSHARALLVAVQTQPAAAALTVTLVDASSPAGTIDLTGAVVTASGAWSVLTFALPQGGGSFDWSHVSAVRYSALDATATYTLGPVLLEADPALDLVVMGGDGTSAGAGRFYGDGLAATKESNGTYLTQADLPQADTAALKPVDSGRRRIDWAYLDLWERPITYVEHPSLRDVALDGDDTCARRQLVAQVRLLQGDDVPLESEAVPPSAIFDALPRIGRGVLSTKDTPAAVLDPCADPCEPRIAGPYLGEDNRLFRVEIQRAGDVGPADQPATAVFKWSRNNGAITTALVADAAAGEFSAIVERPELFSIGDLVELSDDLMELATGVYEDRVHHTHHTRGELRRLVTVNLQTRRISWQDPTVVDPAEAPFHAALPNAMRRAYHAKVTQWDGVAAVTAGDIVLADGVVIEFDGSAMIAGDYWQFATRTADRSVERLIEAPPCGSRHAFYPLAAIHRSRPAGTPEIVFAEDLRPRFAALPALDASRIAYDPGAGARDTDIDGWDTVTTVQQAIDALCLADLSGDLKLHNKLLHGMGVICGLKLRCSSDRTRVILGSGYALDCEGALMHQDGEVGVPLVKMAEAQGLLDASGNGKVNLWIDQGPTDLDVHIEPYVPESFWDTVLEGTLLRDFWEKAVLALVDFVKSQLLPFPSTTLPLPERHERVLSLINLIWQTVNAANGPYVFVSKAEHDLLAKFYADLKSHLASKTYCGMFDTLTTFPDYPYTVPPGIDTMFGLFVGHRRMKIVPGGAYAVTYGVGNLIQVFHIPSRTAVAVATFPGAANLNVRDVAFNGDGTEMYAVGTIQQGGETDSVFATATLTPAVAPATAPTISWGPATVVCDIEFVTLATHAAQSNRLFAIGRSDVAAQQGLYRFTLPVIPLVPAPLVTFNATGLFAIDSNGVDAVAAAHSNPAVLDGSFTGLRRINLNMLATSMPAAFAAAGRDLFDDLVVSNGAVFLTGHIGATSTLFRFNLPAETAQPPVPIGPLSLWRLALLPAGNALAIADANTYRARLFDTGTSTIIGNLRIPLQIMPIALAVSPDQREVYALNMTSNTVSAIDIGTLRATTPSFTAEPPVTLAAYRKQMLTAFTDLGGVLVQYLKDAWCDLFLVECPTCNRTDHVYLGTVDIRNQRTFNIMPFSKRHYSKSFRTWGYWLSAFPVLNVVKTLFARFAAETLVP